jgi:uncharacterized protein
MVNAATPDSDDLIARLHPRIDEIPKTQWDALVAAARIDQPDDPSSAADNPFTNWDFLDALEKNACVQIDYGWSPLHLAIYHRQQLVAAAPCYLKGNSHGEFVFDWAWAHAYQQHRRAYYPKLLVASPYSPVTAPKLLARSRELKLALLETLSLHAEQKKLSSIHANFLTESDAALLAHEPWLPRFDWQFHWQQRNWQDFDDFLASLSAKKRKNICQERQKVQRAGIVLRTLHGDAINRELWAEIHALYVSTFEYKGNTPVLTPEFFIDYARRAPKQIIAVLAYRDAELVAMALFFRSSTTLYGRYWGAHEDIPGLHFECCYYQGIEYCLRENLQRFEPGAQGEHKIARGFLPTRVRSAHYIADPQFRAAIRNAIDHEGRQLRDYLASISEHNPYRD